MKDSVRDGKGIVHKEERLQRMKVVLIHIRHNAPLFLGQIISNTLFTFFKLTAKLPTQVL